MKCDSSTDVRSDSSTEMRSDSSTDVTEMIDVAEVKAAQQMSGGEKQAT